MVYERCPTDFGWGGLVGVTYDFPGKDTIRAEMTTHKTMMLKWNAGDVKTIHNSLFNAANEPYEQMPLPWPSPSWAKSAAPALPFLDENHQFVGFAAPSPSPGSTHAWPRWASSHH